MLVNGQLIPTGLGFMEADGENRVKILCSRKYKNKLSYLALVGSKYVEGRWWDIYSVDKADKEDAKQNLYYSTAERSKVIIKIESY